MKGLLIKDLRLLKNQKTFYISICIVGLIFLISGYQPLFTVSYLTMMLSMCAVSTISYDEYDNGAAFLFTLPISRQGYVREKYLFGFLVNGCGWLFFTAVTLAFRALQGLPSDIPEYLVTSISVLAVAYLIQAIMMPVQLKFGAEKRQTIMLGIFGAVFGGAWLGAKLFRRLGVSSETAGMIVKDLFGHGLPLLIILVSTFFAFFFLISYRLSVRILGRKEL